MGALSPVHWAIVIVVLLLLFGSRKLPDMARGLGQSMRILKAESKALQDDDRRDGPAVGPGRRYRRSCEPRRPPGHRGRRSGDRAARRLVS